MMMETNNSRKIRPVYVGLLREEYLKIESQYKKSTCHSLSEYLRKLLSGKPVTILYRNQSLDDLIEEIVTLNSELNNTESKAIEVLKKIKNDKLPLTTTEFEVQISNLNKKIDQIKTQIEKITDQWLQS